MTAITKDDRKLPVLSSHTWKRATETSHRTVPEYRFPPINSTMLDALFHHEDRENRVRNNNPQRLY